MSSLLLKDLPYNYAAQLYPDPLDSKDTQLEISYCAGCNEVILRVKTYENRCDSCCEVVYCGKKCTDAYLQQHETTCKWKVIAKVNNSLYSIVMAFCFS